MYKILKKVGQFILGVLFVAILLFIIFGLTKEVFDFDIDNGYIFSITASITVIFALFFKKHRVFFITTCSIGAFFIVLHILAIRDNIVKKNRNHIYYDGHTSYWNSTNHSTTIPFNVSDDNFIYLQSKIDCKFYNLLFDTGASAMILQQGIGNSVFTGRTTNSTDGNNITLYDIPINRLDSFSLGELVIHKPKYKSLLDINSYENKPWAKKHPIAGALGMDIIKSFIWDFDMKNKIVTISEKKIDKEQHKGLTLPLLKEIN